MELLKAIQPYFSIIIVLINVGFFMVIKFNDLRHLKIKVDELSNKFDKLDERTDEQGERISHLEGKLNGK